MESNAHTTALGDNQLAAKGIPSLVATIKHGGKKTTHMSRQELRLPGGKLIGYTQERNGKIEGRDSGGSLKGTYDPRTNETRSPGGSLVGKGDMLASLITNDAC